MDARRALCDFKGALYEPEKWPRGRKMGSEGACPGFLDMGFGVSDLGGLVVSEHRGSFQTSMFWS